MTVEDNDMALSPPPRGEPATHQYTAHLEGANAVDNSETIKELRSIESSLVERAAKVQQAQAAIISAQSQINADASLAAAKAAADAWRINKDRQRLVPKAIKELSPLGVQAVVAERNELRYQLRAAAAELQKIEASQRALPDLVNLTEDDIARVSNIRRSMEMEQQRLGNAVASVRRELEVCRDEKIAIASELSTTSEQLAERATAVVDLGKEITNLKEEIEEITLAAKEQLHSSLQAQHKELSKQRAMSCCRPPTAYSQRNLIA